MENHSEWILAIETDKPVWHERLTAYCTGLVGENEEGRDEQQIFIEDLGEEKMEDFFHEQGMYIDDHGCHQPSSNCFDREEGVMLYFCERPSKEKLVLIKARADAYCFNDEIEILGFRLIEKIVQYIELEEE